MTSDDTHKKIAAAVERMPTWLRQDLVSKDIVLRSRAEEALAAIIAAALKG